MQPQLFEKENAYEVFKHQQAEKEKVLASQVGQEGDGGEAGESGNLRHCWLNFDI
jgi:hypothetical protein